VIRRGVIIGIGAVLLGVGVTGLALVQTGVICQLATTGPAKLAELKLPEPPAQMPQPGSGSSNPAAVPAVKAPPKAAPSQASGPTAQPRPSQPPAQMSQSGGGPSTQVGQQQRGGAESSAEPGRRSHRQGFDEKRLKTQLKSESRRYAAKPESKQLAGESNPVVIRFNFDPAKGRRLNVAQVRLGDKIRVKVKKVGQVGRRVYFTFSKKLDSPQGAILELQTMYSFDRAISRRGGGYYVIEVKIYPGNRWNIPPRSFV